MTELQETILLDTRTMVSFLLIIEVVAGIAILVTISKLTRWRDKK